MISWRLKARPCPSYWTVLVPDYQTFLKVSAQLPRAEVIRRLITAGLDHSSLNREKNFE
jgi:hypothetical protein